MDKVPQNASPPAAAQIPTILARPASQPPPQQRLRTDDVMAWLASGSAVDAIGRPVGLGVRTSQLESNRSTTTSSAAASPVHARPIAAAANVVHTVAPLTPAPSASGASVDIAPAIRNSSNNATAAAAADIAAAASPPKPSKRKKASEIAAEIERKRRELEELQRLAAAAAADEDNDDDEEDGSAPVPTASVADTSAAAQSKPATVTSTLAGVGAAPVATADEVGDGGTAAGGFFDFSATAEGGNNLLDTALEDGGTNNDDDVVEGVLFNTELEAGDDDAVEAGLTAGGAGGGGGRRSEIDYDEGEDELYADMRGDIEELQWGRDDEDMNKQQITNNTPITKNKNNTVGGPSATSAHRVALGPPITASSSSSSSGSGFGARAHAPPSPPPPPLSVPVTPTAAGLTGTATARLPPGLNAFASPPSLTSQPLSPLQQQSSSQHATAALPAYSSTSSDGSAAPVARLPFSLPSFASVRARSIAPSSSASQPQGAAAPPLPAAKEEDKVASLPPPATASSAASIAAVNPVLSKRFPLAAASAGATTGSALAATSSSASAPPPSSAVVNSSRSISSGTSSGATDSLAERLKARTSAASYSTTQTDASSLLSIRATKFIPAAVRSYFDALTHTLILPTEDRLYEGQKGGGSGSSAIVAAGSGAAALHASGNGSSSGALVETDLSSFLSTLQLALEAAMPGAPEEAASLLTMLRLQLPAAKSVSPSFSPAAATTTTAGTISGAGATCSSNTIIRWGPVPKPGMEEGGLAAPVVAATVDPVTALSPASYAAHFTSLIAAEVVKSRSEIPQFDLTLAEPLSLLEAPASTSPTATGSSSSPVAGGADVKRPPSLSTVLQVQGLSEGKPAVDYGSFVRLRPLPSAAGTAPPIESTLSRFSPPASVPSYEVEARVQRVLVQREQVLLRLPSRVVLKDCAMCLVMHGGTINQLSNRLQSLLEATQQPRGSQARLSALQQLGLINESQLAAEIAHTASQRATLLDSIRPATHIALPCGDQALCSAHAQGLAAVGFLEAVRMLDAAMMASPGVVVDYATLTEEAYVAGPSYGVLQGVRILSLPPAVTSLIRPIGPPRYEPRADGRPMVVLPGVAPCLCPFCKTEPIISVVEETEALQLIAAASATQRIDALSSPSAPAASAADPTAALKSLLGLQSPSPTPTAAAAATSPTAGGSGAWAALAAAQQQLMIQQQQQLMHQQLIQQQQRQATMDALSAAGDPASLALKVALGIGATVPSPQQLAAARAAPILEAFARSHTYLRERLLRPPTHFQVRFEYLFAPVSHIIRSLAGAHRNYQSLAEQVVAHNDKALQLLRDVGPCVLPGLVMRKLRMLPGPLADLIEAADNATARSPAAAELKLRFEASVEPTRASAGGIKVAVKREEAKVHAVQLATAKAEYEASYKALIVQERLRHYYLLPDAAAAAIRAHLPGRLISQPGPLHALLRHMDIADRRALLLPASSPAAAASEASASKAHQLSHHALVRLFPSSVDVVLSLQDRLAAVGDVSSGTGSADTDESAIIAAGRVSGNGSAVAPATSSSSSTATVAGISDHAELIASSLGIRWVDGRLNSAQRSAVVSIVSGGHGPIPFLLIGPAGTGKTSCLTEAITQVLLTASLPPQRPTMASSLSAMTGGGGRILVVAPSDEAADVVLAGLVGNWHHLQAAGLAPVHALPSASFSTDRSSSSSSSDSSSAGGLRGVLRFNLHTRRTDSIRTELASALKPFCLFEAVPDPSSPSLLVGTMPAPVAAAIGDQIFAMPSPAQLAACRVIVCTAVAAGTLAQLCVSDGYWQALLAASPAAQSAAKGKAASAAAASGLTSPSSLLRLSHAFYDEASQALEVESLVALGLAGERFVDRTMIVDARRH